MRRRQNRKQDEETSYWLSYSDMMAGLLLTFVLIISLTVLHSKIQYDQKQTELLGKEHELIIQSEELEHERLTISEQQAVLNAQEQKLSEQEGKLAIQKKKLEEQETLLTEQSELLEELQEIMDGQQEKLDRILGVRTELVEALKDEFNDSSLNISVDEKSGGITMDSSILFSYNEADLKEGGKEFLAEFLPRYAKILLSPKYKEYISEIVIEGHTDTTGNYLFNLELSQERAFSVAAYCMDEENKVLSKPMLEEMKSVLSSTGKSYSNPKYKPDGTVDAEASRRVEILFKLKDEEMIREMIEILSQSANNDEIINDRKPISPNPAGVQGPGAAH